MDDNILDDLLRRLTTLVGQLDHTYDQLLLVVEQQQVFNREQLESNARLETRMTEVFRQRINGQNA